MPARIRIALVCLWSAVVLPVGCKPGGGPEAPATPVSEPAANEPEPETMAGKEVEDEFKVAETKEEPEPKVEMKEETPEPPVPAAPPPRKMTLADVTPVQAERALRDVLTAAVQSAISSLGSEGGLGRDSGARISEPKEFVSLAAAVRKVERGGSVDAWLTELNAVAEKAVADAGLELQRLVADTSLREAKSALTASADGATQLFLEAGGEGMRAVLRKSIAKAMEGSDVTGLQERMLADARFANPFTNLKSVNDLDLVDYLGESLMERLLIGMAREEQAMRKEPGRVDSETAAAVLEAVK